MGQNMGTGSGSYAAADASRAMNRQIKETNRKRGCGSSSLYHILKEQVVKLKKYYTAESVTEGHPDKLCDIIADSVLDDCLAHDPASHVACEVLATRGHITVAGESAADISRVCRAS